MDTPSKVALSVMSLNTWGMPSILGSRDKESRMEGIGQEIGKGEYDVYLLQELWLRKDHAKIKSLIPQGYVMTEYAEMASSCYDGVFSPFGCSGLAIVSKHKFLNVYYGRSSPFHPYSDRGPIWDGEWLASKGVGHVMIEPKKNVTVSVFVTHTCAKPYNTYYRQKQIRQLIEIVKTSTARFCILGGDFNFDPSTNHLRSATDYETTVDDIHNFGFINSTDDLLKTTEQSHYSADHINSCSADYQSICDDLEGLMEPGDFVQTPELNPSDATFANPGNTYSGGKPPKIYDYIFHKANGQNSKIDTQDFKVRQLKMSNESRENGEERSLSDHEAVTATLLLEMNIAKLK